MTNQFVKHKKIVIVGPTCSGKTTFASTLSKKLNLPLTHVDTLRWKENWEEQSEEVIRDKVLFIASEKSWIIEGHMELDLMVSVFQQADQIILMNSSWIITSINYIRRVVRQRRGQRPEMANGCSDVKPSNLRKIARYILALRQGVAWHRNNSFKIAKENYSDKTLVINRLSSLPKF